MLHSNCLNIWSLLLCLNIWSLLYLELWLFLIRSETLSFYAFMFTLMKIEISSATNLIFSTGSSATSSLHLPNLCVISTNTCSSFSSLASVSMASAATGPCTVFQPELYTERVSGVGEESWYSGTTALIQTLCLDEWRESHSHGWLELLPAAWLPWQDGGGLYTAFTRSQQTRGDLLDQGDIFHWENRGKRGTAQNKEYTFKHQ